MSASPGAGPRAGISSVRAVLVGLPGSGKTTTGRMLAARLETVYVDTDDLVEQAAGRTVTEVFAQDGEPAFRALEAREVARALREAEGVVGLGGGAVLDASTRDALRQAGVPVVLLRATMSTLARRIGDGRGRPLLAGSPVSRLAELASARDPYYRAVAGLAVDTDGCTPEQVAATIAELLASARVA